MKKITLSIEKINNLILKFYFFNSLLFSSIISFLGINFFMGGNVIAGFIIFNGRNDISGNYYLWVLIIILSLLFLIYNLLKIFFNKNFSKVDYIAFLIGIIIKYVLLIFFGVNLIIGILLILYDTYKAFIFFKYKSDDNFNFIIKEFKLLNKIYLLLFGIFALYSFLSGTNPNNLVKIDDSYFNKVDKKLINDKDNNLFFYLEENNFLLGKEAKNIETNKKYGDKIENIRECFLYNEENFKKYKYDSYESYINKKSKINKKNYFDKCNNKNIKFDLEVINDLDNRFKILNKESEYSYIYLDNEKKENFNGAFLVKTIQLSFYHSLYYLDKGNFDKAIEIQKVYFDISNKFIQSNVLITNSIGVYSSKIILDNINYIYKNYNIDEVDKNIFKENTSFLYENSKIMENFYSLLYFKSIGIYSDANIFYINNLFFNYDLLNNLSKNYYAYIINGDNGNAELISKFVHNHKKDKLSILKRDYLTYKFSLMFNYENQIRKMKFILRYMNETLR